MLLKNLQFVVSPWKAPGLPGIADTHTLSPTETAPLQSLHSQTAGRHRNTLVNQKKCAHVWIHSSSYTTELTKHAHIYREEDKS